MATALTPAQRQELKGRAHALDPVVLIGASGLTPPVLAEINRALDSHELIKIRVAGGDRRERERILSEVCAAADAAPVQHIGKVIVIFRERVEESPPPASPPRPTAKTTTQRRSAVRARKSPQRPPRPRRGRLRPR